MKHFVLISLFTLTILSCNQEKPADLKSQNQGPEIEHVKQDSIMNQMLGRFNQIQDNLNKIKQREGYLEVQVNEENLDKAAADQINRDIELISELMKKNERILEQLNKDLKGSQIKLAEFRRLVENLNRQLAEKNLQIEKLNHLLAVKDDKINALYFSVDSLSYSNKAKDREIQETIDELNRVYYAYGTFKELQENKVLSKEGGFLGLGKSETLKDNFNKDYFSKIDKRKQKSFLIYAKKAELITPHPKDSYKFFGKENEVDSLVVLNVEDFWRASKYMVIVVD